MPARIVRISAPVAVLVTEYLDRCHPLSTPASGNHDDAAYPLRDLPDASVVAAYVADRLLAAAGDGSAIGPDPAGITAEVVGLVEAARCIRAGQTVAFPTETVYGLGANGLDHDAVTRIFTAKQRPGDNPLILHCRDWAMVRRSLVPRDHVIPTCYEEASASFWPGPLTLLLPKAERVPLSVTGGHATVAVRVPNHPIALALIALADTPLAAPSANRSGRPSPTQASHVADDLGDRIPLVLDGGACAIGIESTVLDGLRSPPLVLRPGMLTAEALAAACPSLRALRTYQQGSETALEAQPTTPGMKYRHYSPNAPVTLLLPPPEGLAEGSDRAWLRFVGSAVTAARASRAAASGPIGYLSTTAVMAAPGFDLAAALATCGDGNGEPDGALPRLPMVHVVLGGTPEAVSRHLFEQLRALDHAGVSHIFIEGLPTTPPSRGVMNRIHKAASTTWTFAATL